MTSEKMFWITREYGYDGRIGFGKEVANLRCFKSQKGFRTIHAPRHLKRIVHYNTKRHVDGIAIFYWNGITGLYVSRYTSEKSLRELCEQAINTPKEDRYAAA